MSRPLCRTHAGSHGPAAGAGRLGQTRELTHPPPSATAARGPAGAAASDSRGMGSQLRRATPARQKPMEPREGGEGR
eukprot:2696508-Pyramimonas_sp.AAC.1